MTPLEKIILQAKYAGEIIQGMSSLILEGALNSEKTDINCLIKEALSILNFDAQDSKLKISLNLMTELPALTLNKIQIKQVVLNLARNSIESLKAGCEENAELLIETNLSGNYIQVHIRDNGQGIPAEFINKIFNQYFTTKEQGTGLGLGICRTLIEEHQGQLIVKEHEGEGAWFMFTLPVNSI